MNAEGEAIESRRCWLRRSLRVLAAGAAGGGLVIAGNGAAVPRASAAVEEKAGGEIVRRALQRGWEGMARMQETDGSFRDPMGKNVAVVSLAGLSWMGGGSFPGRGPFDQQVSRAIDFVASSCDSNGFIVRPETERRGPMYGQGFATLFLAEAVGMSRRKDLDDKLRLAVGLILRAQNQQGGWRYTPEPLDADLSVTICQMMALRAARNAGVFVPGEAIRGAVDYVRRSQNNDGGFMYQLEGGESRFPLSVGAIVALQNAGQYKGEEIEQGYRFVQPRIGENLSPQLDNYFFYAHYYAAQAMWQRGGDAFDDYYQRISQVLLGMQTPSGVWRDILGPLYGTAMATLILTTPRSLLPIFQR